MGLNSGMGLIHSPNLGKISITLQMSRKGEKTFYSSAVSERNKEVMSKMLFHNFLGKRKQGIEGKINVRMVLQIFTMQGRNQYSNGSNIPS